MTTEIQISNKQPSQHLLLYMKETANTLTDFVTGWLEVLDYGKVEGFTEQELKDMMRPILREKLEQRGLTDKQIKNKLYNMFNAEKRAIGNKQYYDKKSLLKKPIDCNNDIEQYSSFTDNSALEENARLRTELNEAHEIIKNISFSDDPNTIVVKRNDDNFFANIKVREIGTILSGIVSSLDKKVNFWFEEIEQ